MKNIKFNIETGLYLLAFLLAGAIRLSSLGAAALTDAEATLALQALDITRGATPASLSPHPLYLALTSAGMFVLGANNFLARFWPALTGSLVVLAPWLFWRPLHLFAGPLDRGVGIMLAFFLAIDPGLVALSRQAGSPMLAMVGVLFAVGFWMAGHPRAAGICAGLAGLGGPGVWQGLLGLALATWAFAAFFPRSFSSDGRVAGDEGASAMDAPEGADTLPSAPGELRKAGAFALGTVLFGGSLFLLLPAGWSAAAQSMVSYAQSWYLPTGISPARIFQALAFYEFLPLIAGLAGAVLYWRTPVVKFLVLWLLAALLLALVAPGRQVSDLVWSLPSLWALAAMFLARLFARPLEERAPTLGQALLGAVILGFISLSIVGISSDYASGQTQSAEWLALAAALILLALTTLLVGWGWAWRVAGYGLVWSFALALLLYTLMNTWSASGLAGRREVELWASGPTIRDGDLIRQTIEDVALWETGVPNRLDVVVQGFSSPALAWILRGQENVRFASSLPASESPAFVLTADSGSPALNAGYRGQDFILEELPAWNISGPQVWFRWLVFREMQTEVRPIILWARSDLFPGGQAQSLDSADPIPSVPEQPRQ